MEGETQRDEGMDRALTATPAHWQNEYLRLVAEWFHDLPRGSVFNGEALRLAVEAGGGTQPRHHNAWGAAAGGYIRPLLKLGLIERVGVSKATTARAHARSYPTYRKI